MKAVVGCLQDVKQNLPLVMLHVIGDAFNQQVRQETAVVGGEFHVFFTSLLRQAHGSR